MLLTDVLRLLPLFINVDRLLLEGILDKVVDIVSEFADLMLVYVCSLWTQISRLFINYQCCVFLNIFAALEFFGALRVVAYFAGDCLLSTIMLLFLRLILLCLFL